MEVDSLSDNLGDSMSLTKKKLVEAKIVDAQIENEVLEYFCYRKPL